MQFDDLEYVGFWPRVGAAIIDTLLTCLITIPLVVGIYGWKYFESEKFVQGPADFLITWMFPAIAVILFWLRSQATPGKMAVSAVVVDANTGNPISVGQAIGRYLAYFVSIIPLCLGIFWVGFDSRKQGWHDKLAGTVVVRPKQRGAQAVKFHDR